MRRGRGNKPFVEGWGKPFVEGGGKSFVEGGRNLFVKGRLREEAVCRLTSWKEEQQFKIQHDYTYK